MDVVCVRSGQPSVCPTTRSVWKGNFAYRPSFARSRVRRCPRTCHTGRVGPAPLEAQFPTCRGRPLPLRPGRSALRARGAGFRRRCPPLPRRGPRGVLQLPAAVATSTREAGAGHGATSGRDRTGPRASPGTTEVRAALTRSLTDTPCSTANANAWRASRASRRCPTSRTRSLHEALPSAEGVGQRTHALRFNALHDRPADAARRVSLGGPDRPPPLKRDPRDPPRATVCAGVLADRGFRGSRLS